MGKRGHNEGSIYKRSDGRWAATLTLGYEGGKRKRKTYYGETRREVQEQLTAALRALQQGIPILSGRQHLGDYLAQWLEDSVRPYRRPKTYRSYEQLIRLHLTPDLGHIELAKLAPQDVQAFLNKKLEAGLSARTVQYLHAVLRAALNQALKWGLVARNVATLVSAPRVRHKVVIAFTPEEAQAFLAALKGDRLEAFYTVALALGLRPGEALGLCWNDVNLETGEVLIHQALQRVEGKLQLVDVKTDMSRRRLILPQVALDTLRTHKARQDEERKMLGDTWQEGGYVFTTWKGTPLDTRNVLRHFQKLLRRLGLPQKRVYDLRHACASLLLYQGVHPRVVMEILGHSQISLTMNTYSHVIPALNQEAAERLDAVLSPKH